MGIFRRWLSAFPLGLPGIAILLLRMVIGVTLLAHGIAGGFSLQSSIQVISGAMLSLGLITPVAATTAVIQTMWTMPAGPFDGRISLVFGITILLAIVLQGPGAYSLDARLFGRREIIIPRITPHPHD
jgi:uncharacterized membrane protein YphA (DoxX/SURF4 family)